jgi:hypothetical protein
MRKVLTLNRYDYYIGRDTDGKYYYNIVPSGSEAPGGGYYNKSFIARLKGVPCVFPPSPVK